MKEVGLFGKRKSGKSALMYELTRVKCRALEIVGVRMLVDTVGVDVQEDKTAQQSAQSVSVAVMLIGGWGFELELGWISKLRRSGRAVIVVISKADTYADGGEALAAAVREASGLEPICVSALTGEGIEELDAQINRQLAKE